MNDTPPPPCRVGDLVQDSHWPTWPVVVLAVTYIGEPTEEERETFKWLGYWLRSPEPHWAIVADYKRKAKRSDLGRWSVRPELDAEGRMVNCIQTGWDDGRPCVLTIVGHTEDYTPLALGVDDTDDADGEVRELEYVQAELFA